MKSGAQANRPYNDAQDSTDGFRLRLLKIWDPLALIIALGVELCSLPAIHAVFHSAGWHILACKVLQFVAVYSLVLLTRKTMERRQSGELPREPLVLFLAFFGIHLVFFALIYPGGWRWDDIGVLNGVASSSSWPTWQNYLTSVFYMTCLITFPAPSFIVFVQIALISGISSYITWRLHTLSQSKIVLALLVLATLLPPVLNLNLYPLRAALHSYIEVLAFVMICEHFVAQRRWKAGELAFLAAITAIAAVWRTECIYLAIAIPALLLLIERDLVSLKKLGVFTICVLLATGALSAYQALKGDDSYALTAYAPSLPAFAHQAIADNNEVVLAALNEAYDVEVLNQVYEEGVSGETMYWRQNEWPFAKVAANERTGEYYSACRNAFIVSALAYPGTYLSTRLDQLSAGMDHRWTPYETRNLYERGTAQHAANEKTLESFYGNYLFNDPVSYSARLKAASYMEARGTFAALGVAYNLFIVLAVYVAAYAYLIIRKSRLILALLAFNVHHVLAFLTAPAYYFMYYYSFYLGGIILFALGVGIVAKLAGAAGKRVDHNAQANAVEGRPSQPGA